MEPIVVRMPTVCRPDQLHALTHVVSALRAKGERVEIAVGESLGDLHPHNPEAESAHAEAEKSSAKKCSGCGRECKKLRKSGMCRKCDPAKRASAKKA